MADSEGVTRSVTRLLSVTIMIGSLCGALVGLVLVQRGGTTYRDALDVAEEAGRLAIDSSESAVALASSLTDLSDVLSEQIDSLRALATTAADISELLGASARTNMADGVQGAADVADRLARVIELTERLIPGNTESLAEELRAISDGLEPIPDQLRAFGEDLGRGATDLRRTEGSLASLQVEVDALGTRIDKAARSLVALPDTTRQLVAEVESANNRVTTDLWLLRLGVVVTGLVAAAIGAALSRLARASPRPAPPG
jgi:ABC-type transporter Mla subunit MlaD